MLTKLKQLILSSFRLKLLLLVLFPILLVMPTTLWLAIYWGREFSYNQLLMKVTTDLAVAHDAFERIQRDYLDMIGSLAESYRLRKSYDEGEWSVILRELKALKSKVNFDFLHITDRNGQWLFEPAFRSGRTSKYSPLIEIALQGKPAVGIEIFSQDDLRRESLAMAERVILPLVPTRRALPTVRNEESRAMVIRAIYPVRDASDKIVALLDSGVLLNGNFDFVDTIRDLVYGPGSLPEASWGTVTVFLDDVRISTNVPLKQGERALGTRVSKQVRAQVLQEGELWVDRAFVVNDWYVSSYEPIYDVHGQRVGMLYAGFLEAPFRNAQIKGIIILLLMFATVMTLSILVAIKGAKSIFKPIEAMTEVVTETQAGHEKRIGKVPSQDEIGELARQFDQMLDLLQERNQQIKHAADELERKVEDRTRELTDKNVRLQKTITLLQQTRQRLAIAEKLAALGELTAGVAHEINNPIAVMLGNMEILIHELGDHAKPFKTETDLIIEQIYRIRAIVDKLIQYSRPSEYLGYVEDIDVNKLLEDTLVLVKHEIVSQNITINKDFRATLPVTINRQELQQVFVNLLINATHAVTIRGTVILETENVSSEGVVIRMMDDGKGIPPERLSRIFDPFYTTKHSGTGLGLSVSYSLIRRYGGDITVESTLGRGTRFEILLSREPKLIKDDKALMDFYAKAMDARQAT